MKGLGAEFKCKDEFARAGVSLADKTAASSAVKRAAGSPNDAAKRQKGSTATNSISGSRRVASDAVSAGGSGDQTQSLVAGEVSQVSAAAFDEGSKLDERETVGGIKAETDPEANTDPYDAHGGSASSLAAPPEAVHGTGVKIEPEDVEMYDDEELPKDLTAAFEEADYQPPPPESD